MLDELQRAERLLRARMLQLAFTQDGAVAVRACELFLSLGGENVENSLADVPISALKIIREKLSGQFDLLANIESDGA